MNRFTCTLTLLGLLFSAPLLVAEEGKDPAPAPETQQRMEEVLRERAVKAEADRIAGVNALKTGLRLKEEGRLEEALEALARAVALMPADVQAREELDQVRGALGRPEDRRKEILQELSRERAARDDQQRVVVDGKVREGQRLIAERRFSEAQQVLKEAQETVRWMAFGSPESERYRPVVGALLRESEQGVAEEAARRRQIQLETASEEVARDVESARQQRERRIAALRTQGLEALRTARWDEAEKVSQEINDLLPGDAGASQLKLLARERRHVSARSGLKRTYAEEWANVKEFSREQQIPYGSRTGEVMRHPEDWQEVVRRAAQNTMEEGEVEPRWKQTLREKIQQVVHYRFEETPFKDAKQYLEDQVKIPINVDKNAASEGGTSLDDAKITLQSPTEGTTLDHALNLLTNAVGMRWTLKDGTIEITNEAGLKEKPDFRQYDVRDLLAAVQDYKAPTISMGGGGGSSTPGVSFDETVENEEEKETGDTLMTFIKEFVDKDIWTGGESSISFRQGKLFVTAPPETHKRIMKVLNGFRETRTLQVLIQSRFITLNEISFEQLGVEWGGLSSGQVAGVNAGIMNPRGLRTDFRAATLTTTSPFAGPIFPRTFSGGSSPSAAGGLAASVAFLDDFQAQAILTAVEKNSKANMLTAPTLLCFNTQRANMVSVTQQAYIQDLTAVVQVSAVGYDPEIGYVQTGIVFDVRPIVSADRKYITLELKPTVSQLIQIRTVNTATGGGVGAVFIEAPIVTLNAIRTTVSVPDGGTLMIGGLTNYDETHNHHSVPFLSKIPFLQALFSNKADAQNRQSLVILVKAQIIDQKEIEEDRFGKE